MDNNALLEKRVRQELEMESARLQEKLEAIPVEDRALYTIRVRIHRDLSRSAVLIRKDTPCLPCDCCICQPQYRPGTFSTSLNPSAEQQ